MNFERACFVYIVLPNTTEFITAGRFQITSTRDGFPIGKFVYGKNYLARQDAIELDPIELRLSQKQYETVHMNGFFGAIRDAMPDFWGRRVIEHNKQSPLNEFDYLLLGPDDRAGALGFGLNVTPPAPRRLFNRTLDLESLQEIAEAIVNNRDIKVYAKNSKTKQIQDLLLEGTSMGGARPKAVIETQDSFWIAKFSTQHDRWNQPIIEHALLNLAKKCDLSVAESKLISVAGKDVLLVRRFDRDKTDQGYRRHRMVSALTLLRSDESSLARKNWSYLLLADEIRRISAYPKIDLRELYGRMCFNAMISNLDDHPRNHAILAKDKNWRLSPAYDLTPTPSVAQDSRLLAMECGTAGRLARMENLLTVHNRFFLSHDEAKQIINTLLATIRNEWDACLNRAGATKKDCLAVSSAFIYDGFFY